MKPLVVILTVLCVGLAAQVFLRQGGEGRAARDLSLTSASLHTLSNEVVEARVKLEEESKLAVYLQSNLTSRASDLVAVSNRLDQSVAALAAAQTELKTAQAEAQKHAARVTELEGQKDEMQAKLTELAGSIKSLNVQIDEAKRRLAAAEGDRDSLSKELAKLQTDKADLLRQFNDLAALRAQVALLRDEAAINQRLAWKAQGVYDIARRKGAEALVAKAPLTIAATHNPSLNVEVQQHGSSTVVPATSAPAVK